MTVKETLLELCWFCCCSHSETIAFMYSKGYNVLPVDVRKAFDTHDGNAALPMGPSSTDRTVTHG